MFAPRNQRAAAAAVLSLVILLGALAIWTAVAPAATSADPFLGHIPNASLAEHGITVSEHARPGGTRFDVEAAAAQANLNLDFVRQARLVRFRRVRDPELGPAIDTLVWAFVIDSSITSYGGGPREGVVCESRWIATPENTYHAAFVDATTGEVLADVTGTLEPVPTPVCRG